MKYMEKGGFQNHPLMKLTLNLTLLFLVGFWISNFALYFSRMGFSPLSVVHYYLGNEAIFTHPRSFHSMLEVTHAHLAIIAVVILLLTHLIIFAPFENGTKIAVIATAFLSGLLNESAGWLVRFVHPHFAILKVASFLTFQATIGFLMATLAVFLYRAPVKPPRGPHRHHQTKTSDF